MKKIFFVLVLCAVGYLSPMFANNHLVSDSTISARRTLHDEPTHLKDFRVSLGGGYSYRMGKLMKTGDAKIDQMSKDIRGGYAIDADMQYFFKESWGLGLGINYSNSSATADNIDVSGSGRFNNYKETNKLFYVGPTFSTRINTEKFLFLSSIGLGPLFYTADGNVDGYNASINKTTVGFQVNIAGEYKVSDQIGLGLKLGFISGSVKFDGMNDRMNVSTFQIGGYLSFRTWK